jgi:hypothetical protein
MEQSPDDQLGKSEESIDSQNENSKGVTAADATASAPAMPNEIETGQKDR